MTKRARGLGSGGTDLARCAHERRPIWPSISSKDVRTPREPRASLVKAARMSCGCRDDDRGLIGIFTPGTKGPSCKCFRLGGLLSLRFHASSTGGSLDSNDRSGTI
jgi:hypothetical protein